MSNVKIPDTYNGEPTKYTFFDGFTKASLPMKVVYVLGLPWISAIMEAYRYNKAKTNETAARAAIENSQPAPAAAPSASPAVEAGTKFQDEVLKRKTEPQPAKAL